MLVTGWNAPAAATSTKTASVPDIHNLAPLKPKPDFDKEVLRPLRIAQKQDAERKAQAAAQAAAAQAAQEAEQERQRLLEQKKQSVVQAAQAPVVQAPITGNCNTWMAAAGISDPASAYPLIMRESGCNPSAVNRGSGACGMGQQLPCGKWPHAWNDPVGGLIDMQAYVVGRYGSWANALGHSNALGWY